MLIRTACRDAKTTVRRCSAVTTSTQAGQHIGRFASLLQYRHATTSTGQSLASHSQRSCTVLFAAKPFSPFPSRSISLSARVQEGKQKGLDRENLISSYDEEKDELLSLLEAMMRKRALLVKKRDSSGHTDVARAVGELDGLYTLWQEWHTLQKNAANLLRMTDPITEPDAAMREMAVEEARDVLHDIDNCRHQIRQALLPHEAVDEQSALIEIRPGVGGSESAVFTAEVARMYDRFCSEVRPDELGLTRDGGANRFTVEWLSSVSADVTTSSKNSAPEAYKEVILSIRGRGAFGMLRNEAGVQRVQRVPVTVSVTKIQTSTIAVLVLPLSDQTSAPAATTKDDIVDPKDVKEEVMRSRGAGGQHVNKTESAIRLTHEPTGITVSMQDSRSQQQNRTKAWEVLRARLTDRKIRQEQADVRDERRSQIASMDRFDRVRTFNFMQDRVTDHRVPVSTNDIVSIMEGDASENSGLVHLMRSLKDHRENLLLIDLKQQINLDIVSLQAEAETGAAKPASLRIP